jgi:hypothetical protein
MPMHKKFTPNDLLLYLYNETKMTESVLIQKAIDYDCETEEEFEDLKATVKQLDKLLETPSKHCVDNILKYSKVTSLLQ